MSADPPRDLPAFAADDLAAVENETRSKRRKKENERDDLRAVLASPEGRRVFRRLVAFTRCTGIGFNADPYATAYNAGAGDAGRFMIALIADAAPGALPDILSP